MSGYFFEQMRGLLGARYNEFESAYSGKPRHKALRVNTGKISVGEFAELCGRLERDGVREYGLRRNPLCEQSFYTCVKPSADPLYHAGLYYMQEPSASAAVAAFAPFIGERVLDLCAAPGGKCTQAAAFMRGGFIVCNEVDSERKWALIENIERLGISNALVTSASADKILRSGCGGCFDTLIVDAPCSGGGMMRYESVPYTADIVAGCAGRQRDILDSASGLLAAGGYMLYSTCTFAPEENEENIKYLLGKGFKTVDIPLLPGEERGIGIADARRIYPHNFDGEGHFFCVLQKTEGERHSLPAERTASVTVKVGGAEIECADKRSPRLPADFPDIRLPVFRRGTPVRDGMQRRVWDRKHSRYVYESDFSHALSHALTKEQVTAVGAVELGAKDAERYIRGEQLDINAPHGDLIVTYLGHALGWVRSAPDGAGGSALKNMYPKNLRIK